MREDGIEGVVPGEDRWPTAYITGLVEGAFLDTNGYIIVAVDVLEEVPRLLGGVPDPAAVLSALALQVRQAEPAYAFRDPPAAGGLMRRLRDVVPADARAVWDDLPEAREAFAAGDVS